MTDTQRPLPDIATDLDGIALDVQSIADELRAYTPEPEPPPTDVIDVVEDLPGAIAAAPDGATLDLGGRIFGCVIIVPKPLTIRNGTILAPPNTNDVVTLGAERITLRDLLIRGDGTTKRGILNNSVATRLERVEVRNICRAGQETAALGMWNSTGDLYALDCIFEGGSVGFLAGGAGTTPPNTIPTHLVFERCTFTRPLAWQTESYACKNAFELKCARDVLVVQCRLEHVWPQGQAGYAIQLTPSNYNGASPETTVENVEFNNCEIVDVACGVNMLGYSQHQAERPTQRGGNYRFINNRWKISRATFGGHGTLMQIGWEPDGVIFEGNEVIVDGDAFMRVADKKPIANFRMTGGRVIVAGTYGVFSPLGSRGANWNQIAPGGVLEQIEFANAHSTFRANFPNNTYIITEPTREMLDALDARLDGELATAYRE